MSSLRWFNPRLFYHTRGNEFMEKLTLEQLSLILEEDLFVIPSDGIGHSSPVENPPATPPKHELQEIRYEGGFKKRVLIIYQGSELGTDAREFLMKVLGAVGCSLKDVALASSNLLEELPENCIQQLHPQKCLVFGRINHPIMKEKTQNYEIINGEFEYYFGDDLEDLKDDIPLKKKLWSSLQVLFHINK